MFMHLGNNQVVPISDVVAIVNITPPLNDSLKTFIEKARSDKKMIEIGEKNKEKALIICTDQLYTSPISSTTLYKRGNLSGMTEF